MSWITGVMDSFQNVVAGLGIARDKASYSSYAPTIPLTESQLNNIYRGSWLARKIINERAKEMTREWYTVIFDEDGDTNSLRVAEYEKKLNVREKVFEAIVWARLFGGSLLVLGIQSEDLSTPLVPERLGKGALAYLQVLNRYEVAPSTQVVNNITDPHFRLPQFYTILLSNIDIHYTRVIRFDGVKIPYREWLQNNRWHDSVIQNLLDNLKGYDGIRSAVGAMIFEASVDVLKSPGIAKKMTTKDGEQQVIDRFVVSQTMKSVSRTLLIDAEEEYDKKSNTFTGIADIWEQVKIDVAGAADTPVSRLFGEAARGLNATGEGDERNFLKSVSNEQEVDLRPRLERLNELVMISEFGAKVENTRLIFNPLWKTAPDVQAEIDQKNAERDKIYVMDLGVIPPRVVASQLLENRTYAGLTKQDIDLVPELLVDPTQTPDPASGQQPNQPEGNVNG